MRTTHSLRATTKLFIALFCAYGFIVPALLGQTPFKLRSTTAVDPGGAGNFIIQDNNALMVRLIVNSSGNVGIGTTTNLTDKLTVAGVVSSTTGGFRFPDGTLQTSAAKGDTLWTFTPAGIHFAPHIPVSGRSLFVDNHLNVGGTATIGNITIGTNLNFITSSTGTILFDGNNLATTGNISGANITASGTLNASTILQNGLPINTSQWTTSGSNISYSNGNVGIGTTTPSAILDVAQNQNNISSVLIENNNSGSNAAAVFSAKNDLGHQLMVGLTSSSFSGMADMGLLFSSGAGGLLFVTQGTGNIYLSPGGNNAITALPSGNVGIGTVTPSQSLEVKGTIYSTTGGFKFPDGTIQTSAGAAGKSPWVTNANGISLDSTIVNRNVTVDNLFVNQTMNIGNFKFAGGTPYNSPNTNPTPVNGAVDTITSPNAMYINSAARTIHLSADYVSFGNTMNISPNLSANAAGLGIVNINGDANVSGNLRMANLADSTGNRMIMVDVNGNLRHIGNPIIVPCDPGLDAFWRTDGNNVPLFCHPFIGTTNNFPLEIKTNNTIRMLIDGVGNVGIGTTTPYKMLTVNGDVSFANYNNSGSGNLGDGFTGLEILGDDGMPTRRGISIDNDPHGSLNFYINSNQNPSSFNFINGNTGTLMTVNGVTSNVGIGTISPNAKLDVNGTGNFNGAVGINIATVTTGFPSGYMLAVNGKVIAEEYVAKLSVEWPDYVFKKDYKLNKLDELESFIKEKEHLPGMPSANEVKKNGVSLADMVTKQTEKIEELTLYMIQMNKELQSLKAENEKLKTEHK